MTSSSGEHTVGIAAGGGSGTTGRLARLGNLGLGLVLLVSVGLNLLLAQRLRQLTGVRDLSSGGSQLQVGTKVPTIAAKRVDLAEARSETISYAGSAKPTVLYVFSPQCGWCARNLDNLRMLIAERQEQYRFIGISLSNEGVDKYAVAHELALPIYTGITESAKEAYRLSATPQTIVVSPEGVIVRKWTGAYVGEQKREVEEYFGVALPGVQLFSGLVSQ